jgi:hypothetical protein
MRRVAMLLLAVCLAGCGGVRRPTIGQLRDPSDPAALDRAIAALQRKGLVVTRADPLIGLVETEEGRTGTYACGLVTCEAHDRVRVTISKDGVVRAQITRRIPNGPRYRGPATVADMDDVNRFEKELVEAVVGQPLQAPPN